MVSSDSSGSSNGVADVTTVPIFVDLQGFHVNDRFVVKEFAALHEGKFLTHLTFQRPMPWSIVRERDRREIEWVTRNHHRLCWENGTVPYTRAPHLIKNAVLTDHRGDVRVPAHRHNVIVRGDDDDDENNDDDVLAHRRIYVKGHRKRNWLLEFLGYEYESHVACLEDDFTIGRLADLSSDGALRCGYHHPNCALENAHKLYIWWNNRNINNLFPLV